MRKIAMLFMTVFVLSVCIPTLSNGASESVLTTESKTAESKAAVVLLTRLNEINEMDKSKLSSSEKRQMRKEVRSIKGQLKVLDGGVYLSVGGIIIIILLLILLL